MLLCVRTTLSIPEELYREVKATAARAGVSVSAYVARALRVAVTRPMPTQDSSPLPSFLGKGGYLAGIKSESFAELTEIIDSDCDSR